MQDSFADFTTEVVLLAEGLKETQKRGELLARRWTRQENIGRAFSLREFANYWDIPERTIQQRAVYGLLPGLFRCGKRMKIRKTKKTFEFGYSLLEKQLEKESKKLTKSNKSALYFLSAMQIFTESDLHLDAAHSQSQETKNDADIEMLNFLKITFERLKAFEGFKNIDEFSTESVSELLKEKCPKDPVAKMTPAEISVRQSHKGFYRWVSAAATLSQSGIRPTRERIAQKMGMSRATFSRKFPEATLSTIKMAVSDWMNQSQPFESKGKKNRKRIERNA